MGSAAPEGPAPRVFGAYELTQRIAVGGMAEIFLARRLHHPDSPPVVIKIPLPQFSDDESFLVLLRTEAEVCRALSHPNLVKLIEYGQVDSQDYLALEYVDGLSLEELQAALRRKEQRLPLGVGLLILEQLLEALVYVHEAKGDDGRPLRIVHRDVTPHNVLLSREGRVFLGDFGIARSTLRDHRTRTGVIKGKLRYLAPEQVTHSSIDARTDVYAAGILLFELATGGRYLEGDDELLLLREAENPPARSPSSVAPVDKRIDVVTAKALQRFPESRYPHARAFLAAVRKLRAELAPTAGPSELAGLVQHHAKRVPIVGDSPPGTSSPEAATVRAVPKRSGGSGAPVPPPGEDTVRRGLRSRFVRVAAVAGALAAGAVVIVASGVFPKREPVVIAPSAAIVDTPLVPNAVSVSVPSSYSAPAPAETVSASARADKALPTRASVSASPPASASAAPLASNNQEDSSERELSRRLAAVRSAIASRGILPDDLDPATSAALHACERALAGHRPQDCEASIAAVESGAASARVDGPLVQKKLARVNAALRAASARGADTKPLQPLSAQALQAYMEGRYVETNTLLNELLRRLSALRPSVSSPSATP